MSLTPLTFNQVIATPNIAWDHLSEDDSDLLKSYKDSEKQFLSRCSLEDQLTFVILVMEAEGL